MSENTYVINIGRSLGSGGRVIGKRLADYFRIAYYDKEILTLAAGESGLSPDIFERNDERKGFFRSVIGSLAPIMSGDFYNNQLSDDELFRIQSDAIRKAANAHSCVFIGRCADYVLREKQRKVNIFVAADVKDRAERIMQSQKISLKQAMKLIEQGDNARANYYNFYSNGTWGSADTYDLCINSSTLGIDDTFELVKEFVIKKVHPILPEGREADIPEIF
ncbi:MAG: cytidylate kinase-like family protein [Bacteroidaceae bacterium]|nr:cytidylate kinase-like family protein [Bacteroidaceae bacterium]